MQRQSGSYSGPSTSNFTNDNADNDDADDNNKQCMLG